MQQQTTSVAHDNFQFENKLKPVHSYIEEIALGLILARFWHEQRRGNWNKSPATQRIIVDTATTKTTRAFNCDLKVNEIINTFLTTWKRNSTNKYLEAFMILQESQWKPTNKHCIKVTSKQWSNTLGNAEFFSGKYRLTAFSGSPPIKEKISVIVEIKDLSSAASVSSVFLILCFFWMLALHRCSLRTSCMPSWTDKDRSSLGGAENERLRDTGGDDSSLSSVDEEPAKNG